MKGKILVVDDEQVVLRSCERVLRPEGYDIDTSSSAIDALAMLKGNSYGLIITDIRMPGMDGIEFIRQAKAQFPHLNVVVITGFPSQENLKQALQLGIVDYLPKPFSPTLLIEATEKAFEIKKKGHESEQDFTEEKAVKLDEILKHYRGKLGSLIPVLQEAQGVVGYLPPVVLRHISKGLNIPVSEVHGVVSFYSFFTMKPKGKHNIRVCLGTACYVKRAEEIVQKLKDELKINFGEVTPDKLFSMESVRCLGACGLAPVVVVGEETYGAVNPVKTHEILDKYRGGNGGGNA